MDIDYKQVRSVAQELHIRALKLIPPDVVAALRKAQQTETHEGAKNILGTILNNIQVAETRNLMVCQDTGIPVYKITVGSDVVFDGSSIVEAVRQGCADACTSHPFRSSICDPLTRKNKPDQTGNLIPVVDLAFVPDPRIFKIRMMPKGSGSENMTWLKMLPPADGVRGIKRFVLERVLQAGGQGCPPSLIGVGLGGTADLSMRLAKEALFRPMGQPHPNEAIADLEQELLTAINRSGIGPMGLGGDTTALAVHVETADTHITMNPVAVNSQCWRSERSSVRIHSNGQVEYGY